MDPIKEMQENEEAKPTEKIPLNEVLKNQPAKSASTCRPMANSWQRAIQTCISASSLKRYQYI